MSEWIIKGGTVWGETDCFSPGFIYMKDGRIEAVGPAEEAPDCSYVEEISADSHVVPGAVDVHIHGAAGADVMDATPESLQTMAWHLPSEGTTAFLATTMTQAAGRIEAALEAAGSFQSAPGTAELAGIHLEGPFLSKKHPGAQPVSAILAPDTDLFSHWQKKSGQSIRLVTVAPEEGLEMVSFLAEQGITVSAGHTDATAAQLKQAVESGLTHVTHLYNGMRGMHHREPGTAGEALLNKQLFTEMIVDGVHIHPEMVQLAFKLKTAAKTVLITDSMRAKGLPDGEYELGGQPVIVTDGKAVLEDETLAGSTLSMDQAMRNIMAYTGCSVREVIQMSAENPARQAGLFHRKGSLAKGKDADLVVYSHDFSIQKTICRGVTAFEAESGAVT